MTNPHNVDICVTCVSDKPPQLPLREELPSLGIEVVFNAQGVGAKASKHESKKLLKKFRETEEAKDKKPKLFSFASKKRGKDDREHQENMLRIPKALSYQSYQKGLDHIRKDPTDGSSSSSSWETNSTLDSSDAENKEQGKDGKGRHSPKYEDAAVASFKKDQNKPPRTVEIPQHSPEEMAIREAFKIFSDQSVSYENGTIPESRDTGTLTTSRSSARVSTRNKDPPDSRDRSSQAGREASSRQPPSSSQDPSTITSETKGGSVPAHVRVVTSGTTKSSLPGLSSSSGPSRSSVGKITAMSAPSSGPTPNTKRNSSLTTAKDAFQGPPVQLHFTNSDSSGEEGSSLISSIKDSNHTRERSVKSANIHVQRISSPNNASQTSEFYDLTGMSDSDSNPAYPESTDKDHRFLFESESLDKTSTSMSKDLSTLSSKREPPPRIPGRRQGVQVYPSPAVQRQLPGLRLQIPEKDDGFGNIVLDLSSMCEEDGQLSLATSASGRARLSSPKTKSSNKDVIHSPCKREGLFKEDPDNRNSENRQDYDIMESPTYPTRHISHGRYGYQSRREGNDGKMLSLVDESSSSKSPSQRFKNDEDREDLLAQDEDLLDEEDLAVIHSPHKSYSQDTAENGNNDRQESDILTPLKSYSQDTAERDNDILGPRIPTLMTPPRKTHPRDAPATEPAPLSPSLKPSSSKDSQAHNSLNMHVSFSHDIEEHYYNEEEYRRSFESQARDDDKERLVEDEKPIQNLTSYEECFKIQERSDREEDRDLREDADEAFGKFLQLSVSRENNVTSMDRPRGEDFIIQEQRNTGYQSRYIPSQGVVDDRQLNSNHKYAVQKERVKMEPEETGGILDDSSLLSAPEKELLTALSLGSPLPRDFAETIERNPDLARHKLADINLYPLHAACTRDFPNRFHEEQTCHVVDLVEDVVERRNLIASLVEADPNRCKCLNKDGDLPVHLLARQLMEWEARWYQKVYEKAREESENELESGVGITRLYQTMSQCINLLLKPVATDALLCQRTGSTGKLLPLHIAAIFTVSYETLKTLLETFEDGARTKCNLENIRTFIPNNAVPLELHDRLSTDFPKWEIEGEDNEDEINWTQSTLDKSYGTKGGMRRSDLMFAYNPSILDYRNDKSRIRRIESRIRREIGGLEDEDDGELSRAVHLLWIWMCTFEGTESPDDNYTESVERIVQSIPARSVKWMASLPTSDGKAVLDKAIPQCVEIIRNRLYEIAEIEIPIPMAPLSSGFRSDQRGLLLRQWEYDTASRFCLQGRGFVGPICRTLFNITESNFPTNFVILPYKLVRDSEGRLGLESAEAANIAMQFADYLLHLTDPKTLLHMLEKKSVRFLGKSLKTESKSDWATAETESKEYIDKLLDLYRKGPAYFYYLDEFNGVPIVLEKNSLYPLVVNDSVDMIRKVLPLMLTGMTLMRGEKAISVLAKILLDPNLERVQSHWVDAAADILGYMYSPQTEWTAGFLQDLLPLRESLVDFVQRGPTEGVLKAESNGLASEWVVELSLVKMVVEMHDSNHTYAGLKPRRTGPLKVLWTKQLSFLNPDSRDYLFYIDFKAAAELKEMSSDDQDDAIGALQKRDEHQIVFADRGRSSPDSFGSSENIPGYDLLFGELSLLPAEGHTSIDYPESRDDNSSAGDSQEVWAKHRDFETLLALKKSQKSSSVQPISLLDFDDDLDLDSVLQLRILLDEQEAKLEFLREKIGDIEIEESELLAREEKLGEMLDGINHARSDLLTSPTSQGLSRARTLLHRVCELEERVLCREVEVGQLKNEIACFELDASRQGLDVFLFDDI